MTLIACIGILVLAHVVACWLVCRSMRQAPAMALPVELPDDVNVVALVKGTERYVFLYDDESRAETLRALGRYASNPELSFTWADAARLSQKMREPAA